MPSTTSMFYSVSDYSSANTRNSVGGLASGMDTDALVAKLTGNTRNKISNVLQNKILAQWKQESYRGSIDKLSSFQSKYFSSTSSSYIGNSSFFNVQKITNNFSSYVNATGNANSAKNFLINSIDQLATTSQYASDQQLSTQSLDSGSIQQEWRTSNVNNNTLSFRAGEVMYTLSLGKVDMGAYGSDDKVAMENLTTALNDALSKMNTKIANDNLARPEGKEIPLFTGSFTVDTGTDPGDPMQMTLSGGQVVGGSNALLTGLNFDTKNPASTGGAMKLDVLRTDKIFGDTMAGTSLDVSYAGITKKITFQKSEKDRYSITDADLLAMKAANGGVDPTLEQINQRQTEKLAAYMQGKLDAAFGQSKVKVESNGLDATNSKFGISLTTVKPDGSADPHAIVSIVSSTASGILGTEGALSIVQNEKNRTNLNKTLADYSTDELAKKNGLMNALKPNADGKYRISVNDTVFTFDKSSKMGDIISRINNANVGVNILYSETTDKFTIMASDSGTAGRIKISDVTDADLIDGLTAGSKALTQSDGSPLLGPGGEPLFEIDGAKDMGLVQNPDGSWRIGTQTVTGMTSDGKFQIKDGGLVDKTTLQADAVKPFDADSIGAALKTGRETGSFAKDAADVKIPLYAITADARLGITGSGLGEWQVTDTNGKTVTLRGMTEDGKLVIVGDDGKDQFLTLDPADATDGARIKELFGTNLDAPSSSSNLSDALFGTGKIDSTDTANPPAAGRLVSGVDAKITVSFDGDPANAVELVRTSNNFVVDGVTLELKKVTEATTGNITFGVDPNTDALFDKLKLFVEDYNALLTDINDKFTEAPAKDVYGNRVYHPLSAEEAKGMSEDEVRDWTEKAKQGILYNDSNYSMLLSSLRQAMGDGVSGMGATLAKLGITTGKAGSFDMATAAKNSGKLVIDESVLRQALANDPASVMNLFTQQADASITDKPSSKWTQAERVSFHKTAGIAQRVNQALQDAVGTYGTTGFLIQTAGKAGTTSASANFMTITINDLNNQVANLKHRLRAEEDRYYAQFARMEQIMQQMNAQSQWLTQQTSQ